MSKRPPDTRTGTNLVPTAQSPSAVSQLVEANLRLVVSYAQRFQRCGLSTVDLIHAGNLGLIEAAHRFDATRDTTFVRFASWWVRQAMIHAIADRTALHPMPPSVLATPSADHVVPTPHVDADDAIDGCLADVLDDCDETADLDETFHDIQLRASGFPRSADRLRSHLN